MSDFTKSLLKTGAAVLVLAGVGSYAYFAEYKKGKVEEKKKEEEKKLFSFRNEIGAALDLVSGTKKISMSKQESGKWDITSPVRTGTDDGILENFFGALQNFKIDRVIEEKPAEIARYGLDNPQMTVTLKAADGAVLAGLKLGAQNQFDQSYYVMREGDPRVYQAPSSVRWGIDKDLFALREKRVFFFPSETEIKKIEVRMPAASYVAEKGDGWKISYLEGGKRHEGKGDDEEVTRILNAVRNVRATAFPNDDVADPAALGFDPARGAVRIWKGAEMVLEEIQMIQSKDPKKPNAVYVMRPGSRTLCEVGEQFLKDTSKTWQDLRFKKPVLFKRDDVRKIVIKSAGKTSALVRESGDAGEMWVFDEPGRPKAKGYSISSMLYELEGLKASAFGGAGPAAMKEAGVDGSKSLELFDGSGKELASLRAGGPAENGAYVKGSAIEEVVAVEQSKIDGIPWDGSALREEQAREPGK
jgi:hypothetical protein